MLSLNTTHHLQALHIITYVYVWKQHVSLPIQLTVLTNVSTVLTVTPIPAAKNKIPRIRHTVPLLRAYVLVTDDLKHVERENYYILVQKYSSKAMQYFRFFLLLFAFPSFFDKYIDLHLFDH